MEKVIIYGINNKARRLEIEYLLDTDRYEILAYSDSYHHYSHFGGRLFIPVEEIKKYEFSYVIAACDSLETYSDIEKTLIENGVEADKIVYHYFFKNTCRNYHYYLDELFLKSDLPYEGIVLGNSYALRGIYTSCLHKCFCNLSWHGMDMYYSYQLLKYLEMKAPERMKRIRCVVLGFPYYFFNYDMSSAIFNLQSGQIWALSHLNDYHNVDRLSEFSKYWRLYTLNKELFEKNTVNHSMAAWVGDDKKILNAGRELEVTKLSHVWSVTHDATVEENITVFHNLMKYIKERGMKVLILVMPFHRLFYEKYTAEVKNTKEKYYELMFEEELCRDVTLLDWFQCEMSDEDKYWADLTHLNSIGAETLSGYLERELEEIW